MPMRRPLLYLVILLIVLIAIVRAPNGPPQETFPEYHLFPPPAASPRANRLVQFPLPRLSTDAEQFSQSHQHVVPPPVSNTESSGSSNDLSEARDLPEYLRASGSSSITAGGNQVLYPWNAEVPPGAILLSTTSHPQAQGLSAPRWQINQFAMGDGRQFGPLRIGGTQFYAMPYPLRMPLFQHLYTNRGFAPTNFDSFALNNHLYGFHEIHFQPEPQLLSDIQETIARALLAVGRQYHRVQSGSSLYEGHWAWPPVAMHPDEAALEMPGALRERIQHAVLSQFSIHQSPWPRFHRLQVPTSQGFRHVLMTQVPNEVFTEVARSATKAQFWLFHEGKVDPAGRPAVALLGGMFLPNDAADALYASGNLHVAFSSWVGDAHY